MIWKRAGFFPFLYSALLQRTLNPIAKFKIKTEYYNILGNILPQEVLNLCIFRFVFFLFCIFASS